MSSLVHLTISSSTIFTLPSFSEAGTSVINVLLFCIPGSERVPNFFVVPHEQITDGLMSGGPERLAFPIFFLCLEFGGT